LRPRAEIEALLGELGIAELRITPEGGLPGLVGDILRAPDPARLVTAALATCRARVAEGNASANHRCALELAERYPDDPGVVVALLLNRIHLRPGQAVYVPPGRLHAYLSGMGIEIMAASDNVVRGGLTAKRVDVPELMTLLEPSGIRPRLIEGEADGTGWWRYPSPAPDFALARAELVDGALTSADAGPQILLGISGRLRLDDGRSALDLARGESVFAPAGSRIEVRGTGVLVRASAGRTAAAG
ncbi:MAG: mannose-6-phosphate isomerase, class I, partial [Actinomycetota bacterium]|nr:mannose-6-phosphate isomerase, class I [Actinomycetota bacterium]